MNLLNKSFNLLFWNKFFKSKVRSILFVFIILSSLGIGAAISWFARPSSNSEQNQINLNSKHKKISSEIPNNGSHGNIELRRNPISNFDSIDVNSASTNFTLKLMLCTKQVNTTKDYGVALVDNHYNIISSWFISSVPNVDVSLNYTTYIVQGNSPDTFFVLAGISNLARALNLAYKHYDSSASIFNKVVSCSLQDAPTIKIFKIHVNRNEITSDNENPCYDFKYPTFKDEHSTIDGVKHFGHAGLKFFTDNGIFASYNNSQQIGYAGDVTSFGAGGYYQYLFYGEMFQYNYVSDKNSDEFALLSTYMSSDPQMGNLYAYYDDSIGETVPALHSRSFYKNVLLKVVNLFDLPSVNSPYELDNYYSMDSKVPYKIKNPDGTIVDAPESDQLTAATAISIAFMMDYGTTDLYSSVKPCTIESDIFNSKIVRIDWKLTNTYILPGWFLFKPNISPDWVAYGFFSPNWNYPDGNSIWYSIVSIEYNSDPKNKGFWATFFGPEWRGNATFSYLVAKVDLFNLENQGCDEYS
ncbi:hypothetical protein [Mycoplasmoides alvi]|uniref:hypothetical protein n=1 Tax=Mycoplasmoides alvi TaxID=78580 RepID=UPI00051B2265|nr:hypothetical protein [Mycoplasmoides alvi]